MRFRSIWLLCATGLVARLWLVGHSLTFLISRIVPDDALYYFVIARNASQGLGLSFDGMTPTNGFHPLWMMVLIPVYFFSDGAAALRVGLILAALIDVLAGLMFARLAEKLFRGSGFVVAFLYLLNPRSIFAAVSGLETPLAMGMLAIFLWAVLRVHAQGSRLDWALLGLSAGLTFLARTDLAIVVAVVMAGLLIERFRVALPSAVSLAVFAIVGVATALPWLLWSWLRVGSVIQTSAVAIPALVQYRIALGGRVWQELLWPMTNLSLHLSVIYPGVGWIVLLGAAILPRSRSLLRWWEEQPASSQPVNPIDALPQRVGVPRFLLWSPVVGALLVIAVHTFIRWFSRPWYFAPLAGMVAFSAGLAIAPLLTRMKKAAQHSSLIVLLLIMGLHAARVFREQGYPGQDDLLTAALWLKSNTSPETRIGAFNAGIMAYFSERAVVNLDGVVDADAFQARRDRRLIAYLAEREGRFLADWQGSIWDTFVPFLGPEAEQLEEAHRAWSGNPTFGPVIIYRLPSEGSH